MPVSYQLFIFFFATILKVQRPLVFLFQHSFEGDDKITQRQLKWVLVTIPTGSLYNSNSMKKS